MVIDLRQCVGCGACALVCGQQNGTPAKFWRKVEELGGDEQPQRQRFFLPHSCMHCEYPSCEAVCPTRATYRRADGLVDIDARRFGKSAAGFSSQVSMIGISSSHAAWT